MKQFRVTLIVCVFASFLAGCLTRDLMVDHLASVRTTGEPMELLSGRFGDISIEEAYKVQDGLTAALVANGDGVAGYKIGFAGKGAQKAWGLDEPAYGRLHKSMVIANGGTADLADYNTFHLEVEVAFVMDKRVDKPINSVAELRSYVRSIHPAFDLPSNRFRADGGPRKITDVIADNVASNRYVLGPAVAGEVALDMLRLSGEHDGREVYTGRSSAVLGNPWNALQWLANTLLRRGFALEAGDVVLSGAVTKSYAPARDKAPGEYTGDCGALGRVTCKVVAASK